LTAAPFAAMFVTMMPLYGGKSVPAGIRYAFVGCHS
jgi:hypothetical protein